MVHLVCLYFSEWSDQDTPLVLSSQVKARLSWEIFLNVLAHQLLYRFYNIDLNQFIDFTQLASRLHLSSFPHPGRSVYHVIDSDFNTNVYFNTLHSTYINLQGPGLVLYCYIVFLIYFILSFTLGQSFSGTHVHNLATVSYHLWSVQTCSNNMTGVENLAWFSALKTLLSLPQVARGSNGLAILGSMRLTLIERSRFFLIWSGWGHVAWKTNRLPFFLNRCSIANLKKLAFQCVKKKCTLALN